jgi:hypothetical protein
MKALSRCKGPSWIAKRVVSLVVLGLMFVVLVLVGWSINELIEYLVGWNWKDIICIAAMLALVGLNWYMVDDTIWG